MIKITHFIIFITFSSLPLIINYFLKRKYKRLIESLNDEEDNYYNECIFITMDNFECRQHLIDRQECSPHCSYAYLKILLDFISTARTSICLCMYTLTLKQITYELVKAYKKGVDVRVITDKMMMKTEICKTTMSRLTEHGITFKVQPSEHSMLHHKFCLIDKDDKENAKMFFGSMNLTGQALTSNFDNVILTNNWDIIRRFNEEFEELWKTF